MRQAHLDWKPRSLNYKCEGKPLELLSKKAQDFITILKGPKSIPVGYRRLW